MNEQKFQLIHGLAGHAKDLKDMLAMRIRNPHSFTKFRQIVATAKRTGARDLIETGTYRGVTTRRAARYFRKIWTIELDAKLHEEASHFLRRFAHIDVIHGDAAIEVERLLNESSPEDRLILFLDGHFSGGDTALGNDVEPALEILETISKFSDRVCAIIVDDFREFGTQAGWPSKHSLLETCERSYPSDKYRISIHLDQVVIERRPGE